MSARGTPGSNDTPATRASTLDVFPGTDVAEHTRSVRPMKLTRPELLRYARHIVLPEVGIEGQERLREARVLCVGAGGLGSPLALYLAAAGIGTLGMVDFDRVDESNLQRQILYGTPDIGRPKLQRAAQRLEETNPHVKTVLHDARLDSRNALDIFADYDIVADGTDNFPTRYLVNDACVLSGIPNVYGSVFRWEGQVTVFAGPGAACYRCLFREPPPPGLVPDCAEGGVLGALPGVIGAMQALEVIKLILEVGRSARGRLLIFDALTARWRTIELRRDPSCPVCGDNPTQKGLIDYEAFCGTVPDEREVNDTAEGLTRRSDRGSDPVDPQRNVTSTEAPTAVGSFTADELALALKGTTPPLVLDVREQWEWEVGNLAVHGAVSMPLDELGLRVAELSSEDEIVVCCRSGVRSLAAAHFLAERGFVAVANLEGGLKAWARDVDPELAVP